MFAADEVLLEVRGVLVKSHDKKLCQKEEIIETPDFTRQCWQTKKL